MAEKIGNLFAAAARGWGNVGKSKDPTQSPATQAPNREKTPQTGSKGTVRPHMVAEVTSHIVPIPPLQQETVDL